MPRKTRSELDDIKRLLMLIAYKLGSTGAEISTALDLDPADVSRIMSARKIKAITKTSE